MSEITEACVRGCTMFGRHLDECADEWCRGCLPLQHHPLCDVNLGPDFEVGEDEVVMTIFACVGFECWDEHA